MMLRLYTLAALISGGTLMSCADNNSQDYVDKSLLTPASENKTGQPGAPNAATANQLGISTGNPSVAIPGTIPVGDVQSNATIKLNPAHGEPGHSCDIAVGAPLNSLPAQSTIQTPTVTNTAQTIATNVVQPVVAQKVTAGVNPAHGQPGHRCDIAVGAPLNSPVAKPAVQPPTVINSQAVDQKVAPGMNPSHGQPGHRCDIAVGAPLNSPVTKKATPVPVTTQETGKADTGRNKL